MPVGTLSVLIRRGGHRSPAVGFPRWAPFAGLALAVSVACSSGVPVEEPLVSSEMPNTREIRTVVAASVLISEKEDAPTPAIESLRISPSTVVIDLGESVQLSAVAFGPAGQLLEDLEFVWAATDRRAGSVASDGSFQAGTIPGVFANGVTATGIQNTIRGMRYASASADVTVVGEARRSRLSTVEIIPNDPALLKQQIHRMRAFGFDEDGVVIPGISFVWTLIDANLGRLNELGYLTVEGDQGAYQGAVSVTGIWEGARASATTDILVITTPRADDFLDVQALPQRFFLDPGDQLQLRAVALNGLGELVAGTELRWSMVDTRAGSINGRGNFVAGDVPGVYAKAVRVEAAVPSELGFVRAEDFASVVVRRQEAARRLSAVSVAPERMVLEPGGRAAPRVRATDESGDRPTDLTVTWEVLREEAGQITATGGFTAGTVPGTYTEALRVTVEQRLDEEVVTRSKTVEVVITGTLSGALVQPTLAVVATGRTVHFSLTGWDENNFVLPGLVVIWKVTDDSVGTIDAFGNFTAGHAPGLYQNAIRAEVVQKLPDPR